jgi:uncharacterized membrane protein
MESILFIIIALVFYALFQIFTGQAGGQIDAFLSAFIFNGLGALLPIGIYIIYNMLSNNETVASTSKGITYSIYAGLAIAIFSVALVKSLEKWDVSFVIPLVYGGSIVLAAIIGKLWLGEKISPLHFSGLVLISIGFATIVISKSMPGIK